MGNCNSSSAIVLVLFITSRPRNSFVIIIVLYILLAIILGSCMTY